MAGDTDDDDGDADGKDDDDGDDNDDSSGDAGIICSCGTECVLGETCTFSAGIALVLVEKERSLSEEHCRALHARLRERVNNKDSDM